MSDILDRMRFPETPEQMHALLSLEQIAKDQQGLTQDGMSGYVVTDRVIRFSAIEEGVKSGA